MVTFLWILLIIFIVLLPPFMYLTWKFRNPYKLYVLFGKKGAGKSTHMAKTAYRYLKKGWSVYSTDSIPGVIKFRMSDFGKYTFPENSVILLDECGLKFDNRKYKDFSDHVRDFLVKHRHEKTVIYMYSQHYNLDAKIRQLADNLFILENHFGWLSTVRKIKRLLTVVHPQGDSESRIADDLELEPIWLSLFGARTFEFIFIPRWIPLFDSYEKLGLPMIPNDTPEPVPEQAMKLYISLTRKKRSFKDVLDIKFMQHDDLDPGEHIPDLHPDFDPDEIHIMDVEDL